MDIDEEIKKVKEELSKIQKNKATEHYIGNLKIRLSKLLSINKTRKTGGLSFSIKKQGNATIVLIGFPSVGKSTLLNLLTNAKSKTAAYEFTTLRPIPGIMNYNNAKIQIIDAPGIIKGASSGKGGGKQILSLTQNADLLLILLDPIKNRLDTILKELYESGIRINENPPKIIIKKTIKGGIVIESTIKQEISNEIIKAILRKYGFVNAHILIKEKLTLERLIDSLSHRVYVKAIVLFNKIDLLNKKELRKLKERYHSALFISVNNKLGINELKKEIWEKLNLKRIYLKKPGEKELGEPLIVKGNIKIKDIINTKYKKARVWGKSVKYNGQIVSVNHELKDNDIVSFT